MTVPATQPPRVESRLDSRVESRVDQRIDGRMLRNVCGLFVTGVTVITTGVNGRADGTTVNSFTSVSLDPPLVLFCLHKQSRLRSLLEESGMFAVNFLAGRQQRLAMAFAGKQTASFNEVAHHRAVGGVPILSDALAFMACTTVNEFDGGDHTIFLGEVRELGVPRHNQEPLIFFRGSLGALEHEPMIVPPIWDG
ncbi:MAG: flavin reductase [Streptosporangiaceae bacterium]|nr:flavin reductase [Streptosporangiaceae bacterium]